MSEKLFSATMISGGIAVFFLFSGLTVLALAIGDLVELNLAMRVGSVLMICAIPPMWVFMMSVAFAIFNGA